MKNLDAVEFIAWSVIVALVGFVVGAFIPWKKANEPKVYPMAVTVVDVSEALDMVTVEDSNKNLWQFHGVEDYMVGDIVACIVDTNGTPEIKDDIIIQTRYSG